MVGENMIFLTLHWHPYDRDICDLETIHIELNMKSVKRVASKWDNEKNS
jgi:hypothetical protein